MALVDVSCDLCGHSVYTILYPSTIDDIDIEPSKYYSSSRKLAGHFQIVRCQSCGLVRANPQDDQNSLGEVYENLVDGVYESDQKNRKRTAREHLHFVEQHQPKPARLLDVGCATGIFLELADQNGWQVLGIEPSSWAVNLARERIGIDKIFETAIEQAHFPESSFECITLWDVLEHVRSPKMILNQLHPWLSTGGLMFLNLPNIDSRMARLSNSNWVLLLREHLWYFSPETIDKLLNKTGYQLIVVKSNYVSFSFATILERISQYPGWVGRLAKHIGSYRGTNALSLRFPIGEMNVVARKID